MDPGHIEEDLVDRPKHQVFISYDTEDTNVAEKTCRALEESNIQCWMAPRDIIPGEHFAEAVVVAIEASEVVVLLLSSNSNNSGYVESELECAKSKGLRIITFRIENAELSKKLKLFVSTLQWLDAYEKPLEKHFPLLVEAVSRGVRQKRRLSLTRKLLTAAAAAVVLTVGAWSVIHFTSEHLLPIKSFAVLPLQDETGSSGQEFVGYGVAEDLSDRLAALPSVKVIPSSALLGYADSTHQYVGLGQTLKIDAVLVGRFLRQGNNLEISAALIEAATGRERWHQSFHRPFAEMPDIVTDLAEGVSTALDIPLPKPSGAALDGSCIGAVGAYEAYLKGRYYKRKGTAEDNALSIEYFQEAHQKDTSCVPALVGLADAQEYQYEQGWTADRELLSLAEQNCRKALALDSGSAGAIAVLGAIEELRGHDQAAIGRYEQASKQNPANTFVLTRMALLYFNKFNDRTRAIKCLKAVEELEPFNTDNTLNLGVMYAMSRQYREALGSFRRVVELRPNESDYWHNLGYYYERVGSPDSALGAYDRALGLDNTKGDTYLNYAALALASGEVVKAESLLIRGKALLGDVRITYALGYAYAVAGRSKDAEHVYREGLALEQAAVGSNHGTAGDYAQLGLFQSRLGATDAALTAASHAKRLAQPNDDVVFLDLARVFAVLGRRDQLLDWFKRAHTLRPLDYDEYFVRTTLDFERYRTDPQLLAIAMQ